MPMTAFLQLTGKKVGAIKGSARQKTREGKIAVIAFDHTILSERQGDGGLNKHGHPTERRRHGTLIVTKELDHATPQVHEAHAKNDVFDDFELHCYRMPPAGGGPQGILEENHWTIFLKGARIAAIRTVMANVRVPANAPVPEYEEVEFAYEQIGFLWKALTGKGGEVGTKESPAIPGDFRKTDPDLQAQKLVEGVAKKLGDGIGKELKKTLQEAATEHAKEALKDK